MTFGIYTIYDSQADQYGPLFEAKNDAVALRKCRNEFKNVPGLSDYSLFKVGTFDDELCELACIMEPECVVNFDELYLEVKEENK